MTEAISHVAALLIGYYLCYATLAGRLLPKRKFSMAEQEAMRQKYKVNKELEEPTFVESQLRAYDIDRDQYNKATPAAGTMPVTKPKKGTDHGRANALLATSFGGGLGVPQGKSEDPKTAGKAPDRVG